MTDDPIQLTKAFTRAVDTARCLHGGDLRKGTNIPYLSHVLAVASLVLEYGGTETQAIAALLHDAVEDHGGEPRLRWLQAEFGDEVAEIVRSCSDSLADHPAAKAPWWERKVAYLDALEAEPQVAVLVSAADKLHNARAVLADYRTEGERLWDRFNADAGRKGTLWYYTRLAELLQKRSAGHGGRGEALVGELTTTVRQLLELVSAEDPAVHAEIAMAREYERVIRRQRSIADPQ